MIHFADPNLERNNPMSKDFDKFADPNFQKGFEDEAARIKAEAIELKPPMTPSVGRIVHYQSFGTPGYPSAPRAAVITQVNDDGTINLGIFNESYISFQQNVAYDPDNAPGTWHQPPYVPQR